MVLLACFLGAIVGAGCASRAPQAPAVDLGALRIPYTRTHLDNGLELIVNEDHASPMVAMSVVYRAGSASEPKERRGIAHLVEHVTFAGSQHAPAMAAFDRLLSSGAHVNGHTYDDVTLYETWVHKGAFELALFAESERMGFLGHADEAIVAREKRVIINEFKERVELTPAGLAGIVAREELFGPGHPYGHEARPADTELLSAADVDAFVRSYYVPNNATIVLSGDVTPAAAEALVRRYFGSIAPGKLPPPRDAPPVEIKGEHRVLLDADVERAEAFVLWPMPRAWSPGCPQLELGAALGIVVPPGEDSVSAADYSVTPMDLASTFAIRAIAEPGAAPEAALSAIDERLAVLRRPHPVLTESALRRRRSFLANQVLGLEHLGARANQMAMADFLTGSPDYAWRRLQAYQAVEEADIQDAVFQFLPSDARVVVLVSPRHGAPRGGERRRSP